MTDQDPRKLIAAALINIVDREQADPDDADPLTDADDILTALADAGLTVAPAASGGSTAEGDQWRTEVLVRDGEAAADAETIAALRAERDRLAEQAQRVQRVAAAAADAIDDLLAVPNVRESQLRDGLARVVEIQRRGLAALGCGAS